jgi:Holliday junction resolvase RusA-like endonuclease
MIEFEVPGEPVAQGRPRFNSRTKTAHDPQKSRNYKSLVSMYARRSKPPDLLMGPLTVQIDVFKTPPKSISGVKKNRIALQNETLRPTTKPDVDNYAKGVKDACNGIVWKDDSQVVELFVRKFYSLNPRVVVKVREIDGI